jgi:transposase
MDSVQNASENITLPRAEYEALQEQVQSLRSQLDWLKRQLFGRKSEKRLDVDPAVQGNLLNALGVATPPQKQAPTESVTYTRRKKSRDGALNDTGLRFDEDVPREIILVKDPDIEAIPEEQRVQIGAKVTYRLAQRLGSYVVLQYTRPVYKRLDDLTILTTPAPANVLEKSAVDVSFLAGMLITCRCIGSTSACGRQVSSSAAAV